MRGRLAIGVCALAASAPVHAAPRKPLPPFKPSPPDRGAVEMTAESNLEAPRAGFRAALALGSAMQIGSFAESSGAGGGGSLRVGTASGPRLAWTFEVSTTAYLAKDDADTTRINRTTVLAVGGQLHLTEAVWVRFGGGFAGFVRDSETGSLRMREREFTGFGAVVGAGYDLVRRGDLALSLELTSIGAVYGGDGVVASSFLGLGLAYY